MSAVRVHHVAQGSAMLGGLTAFVGFLGFGDL